ncbi:AAA family ATPase [Parashewanella spongiae]|uniref:AAA family ATPase n=1 Tax=Parashewanella spongiae TaxID=342950 RepID=A0A3A6T739_9GAMM|nr:ExeA family protein [Parashewanella spongiae]MCL1079893.1 AAA family ATPase [Parashewanella spongiae]RJY02500.1 AAA family ATPase [Parashewanella spongiae]
MYKAFYGLDDNPFSIAPNPHYLFLSDRHREALAHLSYGLGDTGGFVLLTGEVGTGKTTVSRTLLQQLPENTDTAFILNPALTELELLATLCDELHITYSENPTLKQLTDRISEFLLNNHKKGRDTLLIIDEAQHLKPAVLEQLRLLTNLETNTKKLLQVILIGQPELQQLLKRQELRQLAQRITARYHLLSLSEEEIGRYVQHRLQVAGRNEPLFSRKAIKALHKYSGGIPRLTNLLCERALMAGYAKSATPIDHHMINLAANEILGEQEQQNSNLLWPAITVLTLGIAFGGAYAYFNSSNDDSITITETQQTELQPVKPPQLPTTQTKDKSNVKQLSATKSISADQQIIDAAISQSGDINTAFSILFDLWGKSAYQGLTPCQSAQLQKLSCHQQQGDWQVLLDLNYPAVLYLHDEHKTTYYAAALARDERRILLQLGEQQVWVDNEWFDKHYSGTFELLWQAPFGTAKLINRYSPLKEVQWLENQLANIEHRQPRTLDRFDNQLKESLIAFQQRHGLRADGIVGNQTYVQLSLYGSTIGPRLFKQMERG